MATPTPVNSIWQYRINYTRAGQLCMTTTYARLVGVPSTTDYFLFCDGVLTAQELPNTFLSLTLDALNDEWKVISHTLQAVSPTRLVPFGRFLPGGGASGRNVGVSMPINSTLAIERATDQGSRSGQGVLKMPLGKRSDTLDGASWSPDFIGAQGELANASIRDMVGNNSLDVLRPCIWSSQPGFPTYDFRAAAVKSEIRTMRRRTVGRGQ